jgi:hypothetical protein
MKRGKKSIIVRTGLAVLLIAVLMLVVFRQLGWISSLSGAFPSQTVEKQSSSLKNSGVSFQILIHSSSGLDYPEAMSVRDSLIDNGYVALGPIVPPTVARVDHDELRYFHQVDETYAKEIGEAVSRCCGLIPVVRLWQQYEQRVPEGYFELWLK